MRNCHISRLFFFFFLLIFNLSKRRKTKDKKYSSFFLVWNVFERKKRLKEKKSIWKYYVGKQLLGIKLIKYNTKTNLLSGSSLDRKTNLQFRFFQSAYFNGTYYTYSGLAFCSGAAAGRGRRVFLSFTEYFCLLNVVVINN